MALNNLLSADVPLSTCSLTPRQMRVYEIKHSTDSQWDKHYIYIYKIPWISIDRQYADMQIRMYDPFVGFACNMGGGVGWQEWRTG